MIRVSELRLELDEDESLLRKKAGKVLRTDPKYIEKLTIFKKSVDARKKDDVHFSYTVDVTLGLDETQVLRRCRSPKAKAAEEYKYTLPVNRRQSAFRPVVVGFGPAGMFAGLILAEAGLRPIVLERGKDIQRRQQDVNAFWQQHILNEESNVQFGEGGAGTFSDGKLTTGIKSPFIRQVLQELYEAGAPEEILYAAKPHIGTDRLAVVVQNIRKKIERLGGEVAEGVNTLKVLKNKAEELQVYMPLVAGLHAILFEGRTLEQVIQALMRGEPKTDVDFISPSGV